MCDTSVGGARRLGYHLGMPAETFAHELEMHVIALNRELWAESTGQSVNQSAVFRATQAIAHLTETLLADPDPVWRRYGVQLWAESRIRTRDERISDLLDEHARVRELVSSAGSLTWRNWRTFEREASAEQLEAGLQALISATGPLVPALQNRLDQTRADYAAHGLDPIEVFAWREGLTVAELRTRLQHEAVAAREAFHQSFHSLSHAVFGRAPSAAELHALYLNLMYTPTDSIFDDVATEVERALAQMHSVGFPLSSIPLDLTDRPRKSPGAFCFPLAIPHDVRISVRMTSRHHLADMLYHELGHAAHFSTINPDLSFVDRYWIESGVHETFSTLFESLLGEPLFLSEELGLSSESVDALVGFATFKRALTMTKQSATALAAMDCWEEGLDWAQTEARHRLYLRGDLGITAPAGYGRLDPFLQSTSVYPAGYVLAELRVAVWVRALRALGGEAWWRSPAAQADIRARMHAGALAQLPLD